MGISRLVALTVGLAAATSVFAGPYEDGVTALSRGDYATARNLWQPLAEQGNALAETQLAILHLYGRGVPRDFAEALRWFNRAAAQDEANAEFNLGVMYHAGEGVQRDDAEADKWYELAAEQGLVPAQGNLGYMYATGQGVPVDYARALFWFSLAAAGGDATAADNGRLAAAQLSPADLANVQKMVREWKPRRR